MAAKNGAAGDEDLKHPFEVNSGGVSIPVRLMNNAVNLERFESSIVEEIDLKNPFEE